MCPPELSFLFFFFDPGERMQRIEEGTTGDKAERCEVRKSAAVVVVVGV